MELALGTAALSSMVFFGKRFFNGGVNKFNPDLTGKIVVITGCNQGIGKITALEIAKLNATIVFACRNQKLAEECIDEIQNETKNNKLHFIRLDLSDLETVRQFSKQFKSQFSELHVLINNAGVMRIPTLTLTKDGYESQMQTNHIGHFLLTNLLLDVIKATKDSRIVNVSSLAHTRAKFDVDNLNGEKYYDAGDQYSNTKLANILFTLELRDRLEGSGVKVCSLHPGVVRTELGKYMLENVAVKLIIYSLFPLFYFLTKDVWHGAQTNLACALMPIGLLQNGEYYSDCVPKQMVLPPNYAELAKQLWKKTQELVEKK